MSELHVLLFLGNWERTKRNEPKHVNNFSWDCSGILGGILVYVVFCFSPLRNDPPKNTYKQNVATHPVLGQSRKFAHVYVRWIQEGFTVEPREIIRGRTFSEMIRIRTRKSELQAESRSYGPKVRDTTGQNPRIRTESPKKGPLFLQKTPLKSS